MRECFGEISPLPSPAWRGRMIVRWFDRVNDSSGSLSQCMRKNRMGALHEPKNVTLDFQVLTHFWFMGREQVKKEQGTFHEPGQGLRLDFVAPM
jgi:hypothetical protein